MGATGIPLGKQASFLCTRSTECSHHLEATEKINMAEASKRVLTKNNDKEGQVSPNLTHKYNLLCVVLFVLYHLDRCLQ